MAVHIMSVMNRHMYGRENILIREDMLCAMWSLKREEQIQYWPVRPLYERYSYDGHVAMYIGGGLIVHASTQRTGIKVSNANYRPILAVRRVV